MKKKPTTPRKPPAKKQPKRQPKSTVHDDRVSFASPITVPLDFPAAESVLDALVELAWRLDEVVSEYLLEFAPPSERSIRAVCFVAELKQLLRNANDRSTARRTRTQACTRIAAPDAPRSPTERSSFASPPRNP